MQKLIRKLPKRLANSKLRTANSNPGHCSQKTFIFKFGWKVCKVKVKKEI